MEKAYVIVGILFLATFVLFIWFVRITRQTKKMKVVHRGESSIAV